MLSKHPERCRFPHGHTRKVEVVVAGDSLDANGMLIDFKALKLAVSDLIDKYDHSMAVNSTDPALPFLQSMYPADSLVIFDNEEPSTEAIAKEIFEGIAEILRQGFQQSHYTIPAGLVRLERIRVWETPTAWAEYEA